MVFRMMRETIVADKFNHLIRSLVDDYRGKSISIDEFETLATKVAGQNMRYFFAQWVEGTGVPEFSSDYQIIRTRGGKFRTRGTVKQNLDSLRMPVEIALRTEASENKSTILRFDEKSEDFDFESNGQPLEVMVDPNNLGLLYLEQRYYQNALDNFQAALDGNLRP